jgi:hypothetical protein
VSSKAVGFVVATLLGFSVAIFGQTLSPVANPSITDSAGKFVGHVLSYGEDNADVTFVSPSEVASVLFKFNSTERVILRMQRPIGGALTWISGPLFYTSNNCSGQAFLLRRPDVVDRPAAVGPSNILFIPDLPLVSQALTINSVLDHASCVSYSFSDPNLVAANPSVSLDSQFQAPFKIEDVTAQAAPAISATVSILLVVALAAVGIFVSKR